jgi:hypothetical protein
VEPSEEEELVLDAEVPEVRVALVQIEPQPLPAPAFASGFPDDEWAVRAPGGQLVAFLREPVARCHYDRMLVVDGDRRVEVPLPGWVYYGHHLRFGRRLLLGGAQAAWVVDWDGTRRTLLEDPDADTVHVGWLDDDTTVAAGLRAIEIDGPAGRVTLPCNHALSVCVLPPKLLVVSDNDGSQWILDGRVVARDWRPYTVAFGDVIVSEAGNFFRVRVSRG